MILLGRLLAFVLLIVLPACNPFGCEDLTRTVDLVPGDPFFNVNASLLETYQGKGYDCDYVAIRNGAGQSVGDRWTCTKCG